MVACVTDRERCDASTLTVDGYKRSGSERWSRRQPAYHSAEKVLFGLLRWDLFAQQTGLIGKSIFQLLGVKEVESM